MVSDQVEAWIVAAVRSPIGRYGGALSGVRPDDLAASVLRALVERSGIPAADIEDVVMGCTNGAGEDNRNVARMAVLLAELPVRIGGVTVNRLCGSGMEALAYATRGILTGDGDVYVAGGVESMSRAPWVMPKPDRAIPRASVSLEDTTIGWRFVNPRMNTLGHTDSLGQTAENLTRPRASWRLADFYEPDGLAVEHQIAREAQDRFALASHRKAVRAAAHGRFDGELVRIRVSPDSWLAHDESPRPDTSQERLARLRPAFAEGGSVTAGNSSPLNDGAAALLVVSSDYARAHGLAPMARVRALATAGVPPRVMGLGPLPATRKALARARLSLAEMGIVELNEAFAAQALAVLHEWGVDPCDPRVNPNGGAIALGHPVGCSGARIVTTLVHELCRRPDAQFALATMCIGVGQGIAVIVERVD
jgi:3-oxoadipyl-CoA thiolase